MKKNYKVSVTFTASKEFNIKADSPESAVNRFLDTFINTDFITVNNADIAEILVNCGNSDSETEIISENFIRSGTKFITYDEWMGDYDKPDEESENGSGESEFDTTEELVPYMPEE